MQLRVRRFFCDHPACQRAIFTERLPGLLAPYARKTVRLTEVLELIGMVVGGEAGARLLSALGMAASPDTLLRLIRRARLASLPTPRVLGVYDFSFRRGAIYGTTLLDLERHQLVDLLPDRTAETFAGWLRTHPGVKYISRDRGGSYAEGARLGAPDAVQIADRFHILKNLTESLDLVLLREHQVLEAVAQDLQAPDSPPLSGPAPEMVERHRQPRQVRESTIRRERRQARFAAVLEAQQQGHSLRTIATRLGLARNTVRKYVRLEVAPDPTPQRPRPGKGAPFEAYLRERWNAGVQDSGVLFRELGARGYTGSASTLRCYLSAWRSGPRRSGRRTAEGAGAPVLLQKMPTLW